ncbi:MAG: polysaccharide pyruvyl transferase family protein [Oscillospiraceae bacterium]|nr:polysaccharide pyruvyl transferase family protein [Oscillospiraceae bacterium]
MKIATITFGYSQNLGALLQAYALSEYIASLGHECKIIKFREFDQRPFETIKGIPDALSDIVFYGDCKRKMKKINAYRNNFLPFTDKCYPSAADMDELNEQFDCFVAGSDQIWNVHKGIFDEFFLSFVNKEKKKIAYAASFGLTKIPEEYVDGVKDGLARFDAISIREASGVQLAYELTGNTYPQTVDPVFLKPRNDWEELCKERKVKDKYIFVYPTQITPLLKETVKKAKKELGCKVYSLFYFVGVDKVVKDADPLDFVNYIRYADLVIGSSFHATAFSLIFEKNLRVIPHSSTGSRVVDLLSELGLKEVCVVENSENVEFNPFSYTNANLELNDIVNDSKRFLTQNLK